MGQVTVFSGPQRRRRWSDEQKLQILSEAFTPGACPSEVARRHDISRGQLYTWRGKLAVDAASTSSDSSGFAEAVVIGSADPSSSGSGAAIIVDMPGGRRITVFALASPGLAAAALKALR